MTDAEKKLLQAQHLIGGSAGQRQSQGAQSQNTQAHSGGCDLEKVLPEVRTMEPSVLEGYLSRKLGKQI